MKKIGKTIIEEGIDIAKPYKTRTTVRGVILNSNNIYMLYSKTYNDYTFPGGGLKDGEDKYETLKRELLEELGARTVHIIKDIGYTEELRFGIKGTNSIYLQTSYYILCDIDHIGNRLLNKREQTELSTPVYVNIDEVIAHNEKALQEEKHNQKGFQTVLKRENMVLSYIKDNILK